MGSTPTPASRLIRVAAGCVLVAYPVLVWWGLTARGPRWTALVLLGLLVPAALLRGRAARSPVGGIALVPLVTIAALASAAALDRMGFMLAVPVAVNAVLLLSFGATLRAGSVPMIERFARLQEPSLSLEQRAWCRGWTRIWCGFFVVNGAIALALGAWAPVSWWALYNGMLAYGLIGGLLLLEWWLRRQRFPRPVARPKVRES